MSNSQVAYFKDKESRMEILKCVFSKDSKFHAGEYVKLRNGYAITREEFEEIKRKLPEHLKGKIFFGPLEPLLNLGD